jgi:flagellar assembly protein FliH
MSSSASPAAIPSMAPRDLKGEAQAVPFSYDEVAGKKTLACAAFPISRAEGESADPTKQSLEREAQARESGRQQGVAEAMSKFHEQLARERTALAAAVEKFAKERAAYYGRIEEEAVQLALSIARKILHREAQVDPLLLMGIVRVALEKIDSAIEVKLAVHPQRAAQWRRQMASCEVSQKKLEIVEDPSLPLEQCELRTSMGTAALDVELQLKEIEQGLMDLLAARPQVGA